VAARWQLCLPVWACACAALLTLAAPARTDNPGDKKAQGKQIPLNLIYSSEPQKGVKPIREHNKGCANELQELLGKGSSLGASNLFLTRGDDVAAAVLATWQVFTASVGVNHPVALDPKSKSGQYWLVVYFGRSGSTPPRWQVSSVDLKENTVRLVFSEDHPESDDSNPYFVWVPLGKLAPGSYTLELVNGAQQQTVLSRQVKIP
jgi:hypothetical protein